MLCETVYAYGTTIRVSGVWYRKTYHTRMVRTVRVRYVPYAYGIKYAYGTQQFQLEVKQSISAGVARNFSHLYTKRPDIQVGMEH